MSMKALLFALVVIIPCACAQQQSEIVIETIDTYDSKKFLVQCTTPCNISSIRTFGGTGTPGHLGLKAWTTDQYYVICMTYSKTSTNVTCDQFYMAHLQDTSFLIFVSTWNRVNNVTLSVSLNGTAPTITDVGHPSARVRQDASGKDYVEVLSGYDEVYELNLRRVRVGCSGNCRRIKFSSEGGRGNVKLYGSKGEPAFIVGGVCINNCICKSNERGNVDVCKDDQGNDAFDIDSEYFWVDLEPDWYFSTVIAKVTGDNIIDVWDVVIDNNGVKLSNGSLVGVLQGPFTGGQSKHLVVHSLQGKVMTDVRIEFFGAGDDELQVIAGSSKDDNSLCDGRNVCQNPFHPGTNEFAITFNALKNFNHLVYVRVYGNNLQQFRD